MTTQMPVGNKIPRRPAFADYGVQLRPVRRPVLQFLLYGLPWAILIVLVIEMVQSFTDPTLKPSDIDWLLFSAQFTAALALFAFQMLMQQIPEAFDVLWSRDIIALKQTPKPAAPEIQAPKAADNADGSSPGLVRQYADFIRGVEDSLNHRGSLILGILFAGLGIVRFPYEAGGISPFLDELASMSMTDRLDVLFEGLIGFIIGLMAWRMVFTALQVSELGNRFDLKVKFEHPDAAGGLEPLGNLCLWDALVLSIAGIFFGVWLIIGPRVPRYYDSSGHFFYNSLYYSLLLVPIILAPITFILPLWSVHRLMVEKAVAIKRDLDNLGENIDRLGRELLTSADELDPEQAQKKINSLELMRQLYRSNQNIPSWPLNVGLLTKFATAQIVPLLGLTGLGAPLLKVVDALAKFLGQ